MKISSNTSGPTGPGAASEAVTPLAAQDGLQETIKAVNASIEQLESLTQLLDQESDFQVEPVGFEIPDTFVLSIVIPAFNEQDTIYEILGRVASLPIRKEIIVVNDHSTDATRSRLDALNHLGELKIVNKPKNEGKGAALRTGFEHATGDVVVVQDADLEYDPRDILGLLKPILEDEADVVYGSRFLENKEQDPSWIHRFGNQVLTVASNCFTGLKLTDMETCYKVFRREILQGIEIKQNRFGFEPEITAKLARRKVRFRELPISYHSRGYEEGKKIGLRDAFNAFYCIVRYGLRD